MTRDARSSIPQSHATATLPAAPSCRGTSFQPVPLQSVQFSRGIANPGFQPALLLSLLWPVFRVLALPGRTVPLATPDSIRSRAAHGKLSMARSLSENCRRNYPLTGLALRAFCLSWSETPAPLASTPRDGPAGGRASRLKCAILDGTPLELRRQLP